MLVQVRMLAFHDENDPKFREVTIPDDADNPLEAVYYYGQNDFQPVENCCSLSVGDVIFYENEKFLISPLGFYKLSETEFNELESLERRERHFRTYEFKPNS